MKKNEVKIGRIYYATVTNKKVEVQIDEEKTDGGWSATNLFYRQKGHHQDRRRLQGLRWQYKSHQDRETGQSQGQPTRRK